MSLWKLFSCAKVLLENLFVDLMEQHKDITTEIHPHYKDLFPDGAKDMTAFYAEISNVQ